MNTKPMLTAITLALGASFAAQAMDHQQPRSREEVRAEARAEVRNPTIAKGEGPQMDDFAMGWSSSMLSRQTVRGDAAAATRNNTVAKGEGPTRVATQGGEPAVRAEVKAEAVEAVAAGAVEKGPSVQPLMSVRD